MLFVLCPFQFRFSVYDTRTFGNAFQMEFGTFLGMFAYFLFIFFHKMVHYNTAAAEFCGCLNPNLKAKRLKTNIGNVREARPRTYQYLVKLEE